MSDSPQNPQNPQNAETLSNSQNQQHANHLNDLNDLNDSSNLNDSSDSRDLNAQNLSNHQEARVSAFNQPAAKSFLNEGGMVDFSTPAQKIKDFEEKKQPNESSMSGSSTGYKPAAGATTAESQDPNLLLKIISYHLDNLSKEMRTARRGRWLGRIILWLALIILAFILFGSHFTSSESMGTHNHTAVIEIKGEIAEGELASADNIKYSIQEAFENENAKGIILKINSPGGSPVQAGMIYDEIMRQKQKYPKKKIYAVVEEICASGAYYIAAAADSIYVDKASIVGSIGVLMDGFGFDKTMEKFGVQRRLYTAGTNKGMLDPFSPENPKQKEHILSMLAGIHQQFITAVKKGRGARLKFEKNPDMFSGLFWTGEKSIELGLSDGYGYVNDIADRLIREKELVDYTVQEDFTDKIAKRFGASIGASVSTHMNSMGLNPFVSPNTENKINVR